MWLKMTQDDQSKIVVIKIQVLIKILRIKINVFNFIVRPKIYQKLCNSQLE